MKALSTPYVRSQGRSLPYFGVVHFLDLLLFLGQNSSVERMRVYEAPDHLLAVRHKFFSEEVHRFYFQDIQAIVVRPTPWARLINALLAVLTLLAIGGLAAAEFSGSGPFLRAFLAASALMLLLALLWNLLLGATCVTELHTAVARVRLGNLSRLRTALRWMDTLQPRIQAAQHEGLAPQGQALPEVEQPVPLESSRYSHPPALLRPEGAARQGNPWNSELFAVLLLLLALSSLVDVFLFSNVKNIFDCLLFSGTALTGAITFGEIRNTLYPQFLRFVHGAGLALIMVLYYLFSVFMTARMILSLDEGVPEWDITGPTPLLQGYAAFSGALYLVAGILGLYGAYRYRRRLEGTLRSQEPSV